jgi:cytochrome c-type biogenesis protein CcmH/NrfG
MEPFVVTGRVFNVRAHKEFRMKQHVPIVAFVIAAVSVAAWLASTAGTSGNLMNSGQVAHATTDESTPAQSEQKIASVASLVSGLEERLQKEPDDGKGWLLLAKTYRHLGRMDEAREAYRKADALGNSDATVAAQLFGLAANTQ